MREEKNIAVCCLILVFTLFISSAKIYAEDPPNILFIAVDDLKPTMACYGDTIAITPNIDALASDGIIFSKAYCQQAVCAPSRASLMTSRYPDQTKVEDLETMLREVSPGVTTLPEYLKTKGFHTSATGKIFDFRSVDDGQDTQSWSVPLKKFYDAKYYDPLNGKPSYYYASPYSKDTIAKLITEAKTLGIDQATHVKANYFPAVESADVRYDGYVDGAILNAGLEILEDAAEQTKPFFVAVGFHRPHLPFVSPQEFWDLYDRESLSIAAFQKHSSNSPDIAYHNWDELRSYSDIPASGDMSEEKQLELIHGYYAASSYIDFLVGKLLVKLDELNIRENTIIVLWGDHGWHLGDHNLWCKHSNFEEATRVPLIFSYPGQTNKNTICHAPVEFTDIAPTLCELTGTEIPTYFEGESLLPAFENPDTSIRYGAFSQYPRWSGIKGYTLRTKRYRYTKWLNSNGTKHSDELYDYEIDPLETMSQINNASYADIKYEMDSVLMKRYKVPSTQENIEFKLFGINRFSDTSFIENAEVTFHNYQQLSDNMGSSIFTHINGSYDYSIAAPGYSSDLGNVTVQGDTVISIYLDQQYYDLTIQVVGAWNNKAIPGAIVKVNTNSISSDEEGMLTFTNMTYGRYLFSVEFLANKFQVFPNVLVSKSDTIILAVDQPEFEVIIQAVDLYNNVGMHVTDITLNDITTITDNAGYANFKEIDGRYKLSLEKDHYLPISDSISVYSDTSFIYKLEPTHSDIKLWIKKGGKPANGASVIIDDTEIFTSALGLAKFIDLQNKTTYTYYISNEGFHDLTDELYLLKDTTFTIELTPISIKVDNTKFGEIELWPNPTNSELTIHFPVLHGSLRIINNIGKLIYSREDIKTKSLKLQLEAGNSGINHIIYTTESKIFQSSYIKIN